MEQKNEQLNQILINQYSKLCYTTEIKLIDRFKSIDWWIKEDYRLKIQHKLSQICSFIGFLCFCFVIVFTSLKGPNNLGLYSVPLISFAGLFFALFILFKLQTRIEEKIRLFELMQLQFDYKKNLA